MSTVIRNFATRAEAEAFVEGIEYVNDSSIESTAIREGDSTLKPFQGFDVVIEDMDAEDHQINYIDDEVK